ncbi:MAG TPA: hypothetical protein VEL47_05815 [Myxococcota bacterium]|nr:hypothetical protein [Myxococcota bacterium]
MKGIGQKLSSFARVVEAYFLGAEHKVEKRWESISFNGEALYKNIVMINRDGDQECDLLDCLKTRDASLELGVILITPQLRLPLSLGKTKGITWCLLARPNYLAEVGMMIEQMRAIEADHIVVIVADISMLPYHVDRRSEAENGNTLYERQFRKLLTSLIRMTADIKFRLVLIDNEITLGKKNDALLRRTFS